MTDEQKKKNLAEQKSAALAVKRLHNLAEQEQKSRRKRDLKRGIGGGMTK